MVLGLVAGLVLGFFWQQQRARPLASVAASATKGIGLSESTRQLLTQLPEPVEIRFYALFADETAAPEWQTLAAHTRQLLSELERTANGRVQVRATERWTDEHAARAAADGVPPQNLAAGAPVYLGVVVQSGSRRETLPPLQPRWAAALELDLARAIARVTEPRSAPDSTTASAGDAGVLESVCHQLPDLPSLSLEEGSRRLRDQALAEFKANVAEREQALQTVETRLREAEQRGDEAARRAALAERRELEARYNTRLSELTARLQAQLEALKQLKSE